MEEEEEAEGDDGGTVTVDDAVTGGPTDVPLDAFGAAPDPSYSEHPSASEPVAGPTAGVVGATDADVSAAVAKETREMRKVPLSTADS